MEGLTMKKLISTILATCIILGSRTVSLADEEEIFETEETCAEEVPEEEDVTTEGSSDEEIFIEEEDSLEEVSADAPDDEIIAVSEEGSSDEIEVLEEDAGEVSAAYVVINKSNFPDEAFRTIIAGAEIDKDQDGMLSQEEREAVIELKVSQNGISDLTGIAFFPNLALLYCFRSNLTQLDISQNPNLGALNISENHISSLNVSNNPKLTNLDVSGNNISSLDLSNNPKLRFLSVNDNPISSIDVSNMPGLEQLRLAYTNISSLDISNNPDLFALILSQSSVNTIDIGGSPKLVYVYRNGEHNSRQYLNENGNYEYYEAYHEHVGGKNYDLYVTTGTTIIVSGWDTDSHGTFYINHDGSTAKGWNKIGGS